MRKAVPVLGCGRSPVPGTRTTLHAGRVRSALPNAYHPQLARLQRPAEGRSESHPRRKLSVIRTPLPCLHPSTSGSVLAHGGGRPRRAPQHAIAVDLLRDGRAGLRGFRGILRQRGGNSPARRGAAGGHAQSSVAGRRCAPAGSRNDARAAWLVWEKTRVR